MKKGFQVQCLECGGTDLAISCDSGSLGRYGYLTIICRNEECKQEFATNGNQFTIKYGEQPIKEEE